MNYVGCKGCKFASIIRFFASFYMNYVGCKGVLRSRFHLHWVGFYMNYVGCKVRSCIIFNFNQLCFI